MVSHMLTGRTNQEFPVRCTESEMLPHWFENAPPVWLPSREAQTQQFTRGRDM
jgi:hypothetical protein